MHPSQLLALCIGVLPNPGNNSLLGGDGGKQVVGEEGRTWLKFRGSSPISSTRIFQEGLWKLTRVSLLPRGQQAEAAGAQRALGSDAQGHHRELLCWPLA